MSLYARKLVCFHNLIPKFQILRKFPIVSAKRGNVTISPRRTNVCKESHDKRQDQKTIICNGLRKTEHGEMIPVIVGVLGKPHQEEDEEGADKLLDIPKITAPQEQRQKYVINGLYSSTQGPVFVVSGVAPQKTLEEYAMEHIAPAEVKYGIVGTKEGPTRSSHCYILSGAIPGEERPPAEDPKSNCYFIRQLAVAVLKVLESIAERGLKEGEAHQKQKKLVTDVETPTRFVVNGVYKTSRGSVHVISGVTSQNRYGFTKREP